MIWTYLTPIMYDISVISPNLRIILKLNPMYHYISFARKIILYHSIPSPMSFVICFASAFFVLLLGITIFRKTQDKFIYYV